MTSESGEALLLRDGRGTYYLLPWETLEQARVPDEPVTRPLHLARPERSAPTRGGRP